MIGFGNFMVTKENADTELLILEAARVYTLSLVNRRRDEMRELERQLVSAKADAGFGIAVAALAGAGAPDKLVMDEWETVKKGKETVEALKKEIAIVEEQYDFYSEILAEILSRREKML